MKIICDVCNGTGTVLNSKDWDKAYYTECCPKCKGYKQLDWVEVIAGKKCNPKWEYTPYEDPW
jgi:hypothetical protein